MGAGPAPPDDDRRAGVATRREGLLAGALFIACPLLSVPASLVMDPPASVYVLTVAAIAAGVLCLLAPWERINRLWLHLAGAFATVEITIAIALAQTSYAFFYIFVAVFAAYVARSRAELAVQVSLIALGLLAPVVYDPDAAQEAIQLALLAIPALTISAALVFQLREQLEAERLAYRRFAEEALALAARIRGKEVALPEPPPQTTPAVVPPPKPPPKPRIWRGPALGAVAVLLGIPLASAGLATAGVRLPEAASAPFDAVGIALPNQDDGAEVGETWDSRVSTTAAVEQEEGESAADSTRGKAPAAGSGDVATALASDPAPDTHSDSITSSPTASHTDPGALDDGLRATLDHVGGLLDGLSLSGQQ